MTTERRCFVGGFTFALLISALGALASEAQLVAPGELPASELPFRTAGESPRGAMFRIGTSIELSWRQEYAVTAERTWYQVYGQAFEAGVPVSGDASRDGVHCLIQLAHPVDLRQAAWTLEPSDHELRLLSSTSTASGRAQATGGPGSYVQFGFRKSGTGPRDTLTIECRRPRGRSNAPLTVDEVRTAIGPRIEILLSAEEVSATSVHEAVNYLTGARPIGKPAPEVSRQSGK